MTKSPGYRQPFSSTQMQQEAKQVFTAAKKQPVDIIRGRTGNGYETYVLTTAEHYENLIRQAIK